ncbi:MAG: DUF2147 domain-containing protein [Rhizobiales bacterium]|nr:DUF2147 domain-containing protein [Hyphomicrobiales bacterium]
MVRAVALAGLVCGLLVSAASSAVSDPGPEGIWRMTSGKVTVRVRYCGGQKLCATIVGLAEPLNKAGKPKVDHENPNPALRSRRIIGLQVVSGMKPAGANRWKGSIYNADDGGTYSSVLQLSGNAMNLQGCWGPFCKKNRFIRVP